MRLSVSVSPESATKSIRCSSFEPFKSAQTNQVSADVCAVSEEFGECFDRTEQSEEVRSE